MPENPGSKWRQWARPGLIFSWLLFLLAVLFMAYGPPMGAIVLFFVIPLIRGLTGIDSSSPSRMMRQMIPVVLVVSLTFGVAALPDQYREPAINWILLPAVFLFLGCGVAHEVLCFRRAPRFFR